MSERLAVDSLMTADGEVVQLPTLGPLGPVDAEGGRIPLDTVRLFDAEGRLLKVRLFERLWRIIIENRRVRKSIEARRARRCRRSMR